MTQLISLTQVLIRQAQLLAKLKSVLSGLSPSHIPSRKSWLRLIYHPCSISGSLITRNECYVGLSPGRQSEFVLLLLLFVFSLRVGFSSFVGNDYVFMTSSPPGVSEAIRRLSFALESLRDFCMIWMDWHRGFTPEMAHSLFEIYAKTPQAFVIHIPSSSNAYMGCLFECIVHYKYSQT